MNDRVGLDSVMLEVFWMKGMITTNEIPVALCGFSVSGDVSVKQVEQVLHVVAKKLKKYDAAHIFILDSLLYDEAESCPLRIDFREGDKEGNKTRLMAAIMQGLGLCGFEGMPL